MSRVRRHCHIIVIALSLSGLFLALLAACWSPIFGTTLTNGSLLGAYEGVNPFFWLGYGTIMLAMFLSFFDEKVGFGSLLPFFAFFWVTFFTPVLRDNLPWHEDSWQFLGLTKEVTNQGRIPAVDLNVGFTVYFQWPGFFVFSSMFKLTTGIDLVAVPQLLSLIFSFFFPIVWYLIIRELAPNRLQQKLALAVFLINFMFIGSPFFSPQYYSLLLYPLIILLWLKKGSSLSIRVIAVFLTLMLTIIHPLSSLILISILFVLSMGQRVFRTKYVSLGGDYRTLLFSAAVFFLFWGLSFPYNFIPNLIVQSKDFFVNLVFLGKFETPTNLLLGAPPAVSLWYARFIRYSPIVLAIVGLFILFKVKREKGVFLGSLLVGAFLAFPLVAITGGQWWDRFFEFAALPVAILASYALFRIYESKLKKMLIVIVFLLVLLLSIQFINTWNATGFSYSDRELTAGLFAVTHFGNGSSVLGDYKFDTMLFYLYPSNALNSSRTILYESQAGAYDYNYVVMDYLYPDHVNASIIGASDNRIYDSGSLESYSSNNSR
jgi:hypothetical protein